MRGIGSLLALLFGMAALVSMADQLRAATISANPADYRAKIALLKPGDILKLAPGIYPLLPLGNLKGSESGWIAIEGPAHGAPATITVNPANPRCCNLIQVDNAEYLALRDLRVDSAGWVGVDGVNAKGATHHILVENCTFVGQNGNQQTVAISTKGPAHHWTVRRNIILEAGTGMYFGNSDGRFPFIEGLVEGNFVADTIGYNIEIKWQAPYSLPAGLDNKPHKTIIRDNVLSKGKSQDQFPAGHADGARPNLLVGGFPDAGPGAMDYYEIHGNLIHDNHDAESLFQGSGRIVFHDNLLVGGTHAAALFRDHDLPLSIAYVFNNTVYAHGGGISVFGTPEDSLVAGNLIFSDGGISAPEHKDNIVDSFAHAANYVNSPSLMPGRMDFYPKPGGRAKGDPLNLGKFTGHVGFDRDFNGTLKGQNQYRGAYAGEGANPGWRPERSRKAPPRP